MTKLLAKVAALTRRLNEPARIEPWHRMDERGEGVFLEKTIAWALVLLGMLAALVAAVANILDRHGTWTTAAWYVALVAGCVGGIALGVGVGLIVWAAIEDRLLRRDYERRGQHDHGSDR